jgi:hypothetical protein
MLLAARDGPRSSAACHIRRKILGGSQRLMSRRVSFDLSTMPKSPGTVHVRLHGTVQEKLCGYELIEEVDQVVEDC